MPLVAATLAGPAAMREACFERVRIDSADQLKFFLQEKQEEHDPGSSNQE